jgi:hypothetical protein
MSNLQEFIVHFDYVNKEDNTFIKRTTLPFTSESRKTCYLEVTKVASLLLITQSEEPWYKINISIDGVEQPTEIKCYINDK